MPLLQPTPRRRPWPQVAAALAAGVLAGCSTTLPSFNPVTFLAPYKIEVVQGNVVTQEQVARAVPGMTRAQVRDVLGSPLLTDLFHANRWDYVFTLYRQGKPPQRSGVVVIFDGEKLERVDASNLPTENEFISAIETYRPRGGVPTLALTEEQIKALPTPKPAVPAAVAPEGPVRSYPPLEPRG